MSRYIKEEILEELVYEEGRLPFKYLGVPLNTKKLTIQHYMPLMEKITSKVKCWSAKLLSYAGRTQLIKSILFGVQAYWAQVFLIQKKVIKAIDQICRTFLWTGATTVPKKALVSWENVCKPQAAGDLNILELELMEQSCYSQTVMECGKEKRMLVDSMDSQFLHKEQANRNNPDSQDCFLGCEEDIELKGAPIERKYKVLYLQLSQQVSKEEDIQLKKCMLV